MKDDIHKMKDKIFYFVDDYESSCPFRKGPVCILKYDDEYKVYEPCHCIDPDLACVLDDWDVLVIKPEDDE